jgi:hypothetical protein
VLLPARVLVHLCLQPGEAIYVKMVVKKPGLEMWVAWFLVVPCHAFATLWQVSK